jgi:hypothetical protein
VLIRVAKKIATFKKIIVESLLEPGRNPQKIKTLEDKIIGTVNINMSIFVFLKIYNTSTNATLKTDHEIMGIKMKGLNFTFIDKIVIPLEKYSWA